MSKGESFFSGEEIDDLLGELEETSTVDTAKAEQVVVKLDLTEEEQRAAMLLLSQGILKLEELEENPEQASALVRELLKRKE